MSESDHTPNPRYRGLRPNPESLGVTLLEDDEDTRTMRVRARADVIAWAAGLTAAQRGVIFAQVYAQQGAGSPARPPEGERAGQRSEGASRPADGEARRAGLGVIPDDPRPHHIPIIRALQAGATLTRQPGAPWKLAGGNEPGRTIKAATVELLTREGVLIVQN